MRAAECSTQRGPGWAGQAPCVRSEHSRGRAAHTHHQHGVSRLARQRLLPPLVMVHFVNKLVCQRSACSPILLPHPPVASSSSVCADDRLHMSGLKASTCQGGKGQQQWLSGRGHAPARASSG